MVEAYKIPIDERVKMISRVKVTLNPKFNWKTKTTGDITGIPVKKDDSVLVYISTFLDWYLGVYCPELQFYFKYAPREPVPLSEWLKHSKIVITSSLFYNTVMDLRKNQIQEQTKLEVYNKVKKLVEKVKPIFASPQYKQLHNMPYELEKIFEKPEFETTIAQIQKL